MIRLLLSLRCFIWKILATASGFVASHPNPQTVSVGYRIIFPSFNISVIRWLFAISFVILPANICKKCIPPSYLSLKVFLSSKGASKPLRCLFPWGWAIGST